MIINHKSHIVNGQFFVSWRICYCMKNYVLEVDVFDNPIGRIEKQKAHLSPILHRAFSVFLFHDGKLLLQKRAKTKYHSGGLWANTCCSHPISTNLKNEAKTRLFEEVGIKQCNLKEVFCFTYFHKFSDDLFEYEIDHVFVGDYCGEYKINPDEVDQMRWVDFETLKEEITKKPQIFAPWFLIAAPRVLEVVNRQTPCQQNS